MATATRIRQSVRFPCGEVVLSPGVKALMHKGRLNPKPYFLSHLRGNWGDAAIHQWQANEQALRDGERVSSSYEVTVDVTLSITTESDRSVTTLKLEGEQ